MQKIAFILYFVSVLAACSVYKSPGRKFLEENASRYSNGVLSLTYRCDDALNSQPESGMESLGEVANQVRGWRQGELPSEKWLLKNESDACIFTISERQSDPIPTLVELMNQHLDERP